MSDLNGTEDEWWIEDPKKYSSFDKLPSNVKWLARPVTVNAPQPAERLEVFVDNQLRLLPEKYIAPLMLLSLQELACMAQSFSTKVNGPTDTEMWRNIHFIWKIRESILQKEGNQSHSNILNPFLQRWCIRLVHRMRNSKSKRRENAEEVERLYQAYPDEGHLGQGGVSYSELRVENLISLLALLKWTLENQELLVEAARQIFSFVLCGHIRMESYAEEHKFATKMITNIIDQLRGGQCGPLVIEKSLSSTGACPKRPRGRPKKHKAPKSQEDGPEGGPRTRSMRAAVLERPSFTTSPVKSAQKVAPIQLYSHYFKS
jgi:hypothetical protein